LLIFPALAPECEQLSAAGLVCKLPIRRRLPRPAISAMVRVPVLPESRRLIADFLD
jgi:hypothetical protein